MRIKNSQGSGVSLGEQQTITMTLRKKKKKTKNIDYVKEIITFFKEQSTINVIKIHS